MYSNCTLSAKSESGFQLHEDRPFWHVDKQILGWVMMIIEALKASTYNTALMEYLSLGCTNFLEYKEIKKS